MKTNTMIKLTVIALLTFTSGVWAGEKGGNGGDPTEMHFDEIRRDILSWIQKGGYMNLEFPEGVKPLDYATSMLKMLSDTTVVSFTDQSVTVRDKEKTCKNYFENQIPNILCNISRFNQASGSEQYRLVHHEFAGLAELESNIGAISAYVFSNQITDFLVPTQVLKLAVSKNTGGEGSCGLNGSVKERILDCNLTKIGARTIYNDMSWDLVTRAIDSGTKQVYEVWRDNVSGLIWGDKLSEKMSQYDARNACDGSSIENGKMASQKFELPTVNDYNIAARDGIRAVLPNMNSSFWTSSVYPYGGDDWRKAWTLVGSNDGISDDGACAYRKVSVSVRCVSR